MTLRSPARTGAKYPKSRRLLRAREYRSVLSRARRLRTIMFTAAVVPNDLDHARIGITVSRRAARHATVRNHLKRIAREAFRTRLDPLPAADIVLIAAPAAAAGGSADLRRDLDRLLDRIARDLESAHPGR